MLINNYFELILFCEDGGVLLADTLVLAFRNSLLMNDKNYYRFIVLGSSWNVMAHGDAR